MATCQCRNISLLYVAASLYKLAQHVARAMGVHGDNISKVTGNTEEAHYLNDLYIVTCLLHSPGALHRPASFSKNRSVKAGVLYGVSSQTDSLIVHIDKAGVNTE